MQEESLKTLLHILTYVLGAILLIIIVVYVATAIAPGIKTSICMAFAKYWWFKLLPISCT